MQLTSFLITFGLSSCIGTPLLAQTNMTTTLKIKSEADYYWDTKSDFQYKTLDSQGKEIYLEMPIYLSGLKFSEKDLSSFKQLHTLKNYAEKKIKEESKLIFKEIHRRYFREWGIQFWNNFPNDERRFEWLEETVVRAPVYFQSDKDIIKAPSNTSDYKTIELDTAAIQIWNKQFFDFKKDFLNSNVSLNRKKVFLIHELLNEVENWRNYSPQSKFDFKNWTNRLLDMYAWLRTEDKQQDNDRKIWALSRSINMIIYGFRKLGLNEPDVHEFVYMLDKSNIPALMEFVKEYRRPVRPELAEKYPFEFRGKTFEGKSFEINDFKGKLVFVDLWSIGCGGCIESMPRLKRIYDKYKQYGFEVVSACFIEGKRENGIDWYPNELERIEHVHNELSGNWPLILLDRKPGEKEHRIRSVYKFNMNPNYILFDEQGKIIHFNGQLQYSLEDIIHEHFAKQGKL